MHLPLWALVLTIYISFNCGTIAQYVGIRLVREPRWAPNRNEIETLVLAFIFPVGFFMLLVVLFERLTGILLAARDQRG
ncbi:MAG: hypothetical protein UY71_C0027G0007 [Parcubacteria group bacterium GW2011_GWB1_52_7]|nr:MAG: hypothetical protein UY64_C0033G0012 [Parcubacteria group bacterium GW2011_GWA1_51_12]KKW28268.1 MAG: hypothetical protein UY71_C0027G0007 [Parcubacteria group bacterium GW2011_GWB1_52_7]KKW31505.1 MAG: hypothetical protein UY75_C0006G0014 [Parcubacteria group bacterium GW2011_GWC2_52_8c]